MFLLPWSEQERQLWSLPSAVQREQQTAAQYFPVSQAWGYLKAPVLFRSWDFASALNASMVLTLWAAASGWPPSQLCGCHLLGPLPQNWGYGWKMSPQDRMSCWCTKVLKDLSEKLVWICRQENQIITPDMVLTPHQCVIFHSSRKVPTASVDLWGQLKDVQSPLKFTMTWVPCCFSCLCKSWT